MTRIDPEARLDALLGAIPRTVEPDRDLWPGIEAQVAPRRGRFPRWAGQIAAAVALVAISSLVTAVVVRHATQPVAGMTAMDAPVRFASASFGPGHSLDAEYVAARRQLALQLEQRIASLPPAARDKLEWNLAEMHRAAQEINEALARQPGDPLLEELLMNTYQDELGVLASVNQLTNTGAAAVPARKEQIRL